MSNILTILCILAFYLLGVAVAWYIRKKLREIATIMGDSNAYLLFSWTYVIPLLIAYADAKH